jgi:23S rRNA (uridine2552-2'-O)-methyltransferase
MAQARKLHDAYFKRAKAEGYVARSAYKLLEIQEKRGVVKRGDRVLDLGCSPGSWLQVVDELLGAEGRCVGIDLSEVDAPLPKRVRTIVGDINTTPREVLLKALGGPADVILSDMAPSTTGHGDDFLSARLCERVLDLCPGLLRPGGRLVMKILEGEPTPDVIRRTKRMFVQAGTTKPKASRDVSREMFIWGEGFVGEGPLTSERRHDLAGPAPTPGPGWGAAKKGAR